MSFISGHVVAAALAVITAIAPHAQTNVPAAASAAGQGRGGHKIYGFVQSGNANALVIVNRAGRTVVVDGRLAHANVRLYRGRPVIVFGTIDAAGVVHASAVWRTFPDAAHWPPDR